MLATTGGIAGHDGVDDADMGNPFVGTAAAGVSVPLMFFEYMDGWYGDIMGFDIMAFDIIALMWRRTAAAARVRTA